MTWAGAGKMETIPLLLPLLGMVFIVGARTGSLSPKLFSKLFCDLPGHVGALFSVFVIPPKKHALLIICSQGAIHK